MLILETNRLRLREFTAEDFPALWTLVSNSEVMRDADGPDDETAARKRLQGYLDCYRERGFGKWAVVDKATERVIGYCGFGEESSPGLEGPELGFRLMPEYWGRGLATEAARVCAAYGLGRLGFGRIIAFARMGHTASFRVMEKIGMTRAGEAEFHGSTVVVYEKTAG